MIKKESRTELKAKELIKEIESCQISIGELTNRYNEKISAKLKKQSDELSSCKKYLERGLYVKPSFVRSLSLLFHMKRARAHINKTYRFF
ncbi:hypothetical protein [Bacteroidetes bacterium endosymbiont of Geopemphigus sp.]|uniref:hypothetical protein n=1 Tax=Bacteroidetes bacterium endosymbiont of Geopemphigus sp. TaxID=2047937 RepID=UPI000CD05BED|nr:hypothetical protein [Bacteroidetes bacterium endosymbiont of Geopemphigus sp.]